MLLSKAIDGFFIFAVVKYSPATLPSMRSNAGVFLGYFGEVEADAITTKQIAEYLAWLRTEYAPRRSSGREGVLSGSALDNHWKFLRVFWCWYSDTFETTNPAATLQRYKFSLPEVVPFTQEEIKRLLDACQYSPLIVKPNKKPYRIKLPRASRDMALILLLLDTGLRVGELCRLCLEDVSLERGEITVRPFRDSSKSRPRVVYVGKRTRQALWKYIIKVGNMRPDDPLFEMSTSGVRHTLTHIGQKADVPDVHPHRFRHTAAILFLRSGGTTFALMRMLGHTDMVMTRHYVALAQADDEAAHRKASPVDNWKL